ncbi:hypothetical protein HAX54_048772 [Datura stramonium]|uniref:Uncharacterized protein n=1 Tax=Datura stramonium TaxID=4076 RepID=A0ABS8SW17_DATST|nr:hypothetical protein [Datura stramonium]
MKKGEERGDKPSDYMAGTTQKMEMDKLVKLMEDENKDLDFLLFDGSGDRQSHLKAYLNKLMGPVIEEVMMHNKFGLAKPQSKDEEKAITKLTMFKIKEPQVMTQLAEPPTITFKMLRSRRVYNQSTMASLILYQGL